MSLVSIDWSSVNRNQFIFELQPVPALLLGQLQQHISSVANLVIHHFAISRISVGTENHNGVGGFHGDTYPEPTDPKLRRKITAQGRIHAQLKPFKFSRGVRVTTRLLGRRSSTYANKNDRDQKRSKEQEFSVGGFHSGRRMNPKTHGVKENSSRSKMTNNDRQTNLTIIRERQEGGYA